MLSSDQISKYIEDGKGKEVYKLVENELRGFCNVVSCITELDDLVLEQLKSILLNLCALRMLGKAQNLIDDWMKE